MSVGYLIDTHVLLWAALVPEKLSAKAAAVFDDPNSTILLSAASVWELAIKHKKGALILHKHGPDSLIEEAQEALRINILPIEWKDCVNAAQLPLHHADPFDRMLVAQGNARDFTIVTSDLAFKKYRTRTLW